MQKLKKLLMLNFLLISINLLGQEYQLDPSHTLIAFNVERFMVGEVTGKFKSFEGSISVSEGQLATAEVTINTKTLDTDHDIRDGHLKGEMWLDVERHGEIRFVSGGVKSLDGRMWMDGNLTIKGITKQVSFPFEMKGPFRDPTGAMTIGLVGDLEINRQDYGITFSKTMDNGELFIGNTVSISIRALAMQPK